MMVGEWISLSPVIANAGFIDSFSHSIENFNEELHLAGIKVISKIVLNALTINRPHAIAHRLSCFCDRCKSPKFNFQRKLFQVKPYAFPAVDLTDDLQRLAVAIA
jgi:hypothetical protein